MVATDDSWLCICFSSKIPSAPITEQHNSCQLENDTRAVCWYDFMTSWINTALQQLIPNEPDSTRVPNETWHTVCKSKWNAARLAFVMRLSFKGLSFLLIRCSYQKFWGEEAVRKHSKSIDSRIQNLFRLPNVLKPFLLVRLQTWQIYWIVNVAPRIISSPAGQILDMSKQMHQMSDTFP